MTTHHHLNLVILAKYRAVHAWYIALYDGIILQEIFRLTPDELEPIFQLWEARIVAGGPAASLNNPKIPIRFVRENGTRVYPAPDMPDIELQ